MLAEDYHRFKAALDSRGIIFSYSGMVSESLLLALGSALKQKMAIEHTDRNTANRVFSVFVEQVQNIIRYSEERPDDEDNGLRSGVISVGHDTDGFFVVCGNYMKQDRVSRLRERLEHLLTLDKDGLKAFYRERLKAPPDEESQGATLGLIEIARRSSAPVEYDFHAVDPDRTFFCLRSFI